MMLKREVLQKLKAEGKPWLLSVESALYFKVIFFRRHYVFAIAALEKLDFCVFKLLFSDHLTTYSINELKCTCGHIKTTATAKCRYPFPWPGHEMHIKWFIS